MPCRTNLQKSKNNANFVVTNAKYYTQMGIGRPSAYTQEIADKICEQLATSNLSLRKICEDESVPNISTVLRWLAVNEAFRDQYALARECQADFLAEEIIEIADDSSGDVMTITKNGEESEVENREFTARSRLRVDARKWVASKLKPKKYGESSKVDLTVAKEIPLFPDPIEPK
jgi:hypothetical protein